MAIENLLYLSKLLSRVAIVCVPARSCSPPRRRVSLTFPSSCSPTLSPLHFNETPRDFSTFYDLDRFYLETEIPAVEMSAFKPWNFSRPAIKEQISCWSVLEQTAGNRNINDGASLFLSLVHARARRAAADEVVVTQARSRRTRSPSSTGRCRRWSEALKASTCGSSRCTACVPLSLSLSRPPSVQMSSRSRSRQFDFGRLKRDKWIERIKKELIPQQYPQVHPTASGDLSHERAKTLKPGFDPLGTPPPDENLFCLDTTFFLGSRILPPAYPLPDKRYEPPRLYEGHGWIQAGQFLRFSSHLEELATIYLQDLFGSATIPPFIAVHLRRGDFQSARGLTSLEAFTDAVQRVRDRLDWRMQHPDGWVGAGHAQQKYFAGVRGRHYAVVATTDEPPTSDFVRQLKDDLGWKVVDHERMHTEEDLGAWYPTMIDAAILARGRGFVGCVALSLFLALAPSPAGTARS